MPNAEPETLTRTPAVIGTKTDPESTVVTGNNLNAASDISKEDTATALDSTETINAWVRTDDFEEWQLKLVSLVHDVRLHTVEENRERTLESTLAKYLPVTDTKFEPVLCNPSSRFTISTIAGSGYEKKAV